MKHIKHKSTGFRFTGGIQLILPFIVLLFILYPAVETSAQARSASSESDLDSEHGEDRSVAELERAILNNRDWIEDADRLMDELRKLDVRIYTLISHAGSEDTRIRLVRERNNIRRLIVELTEARNNVYVQLVDNQRKRDRLDQTSGINRPVGF